jgi:RsiW-degrading membrane proteinase PrsW (M82 family)
VKPPRDVPYSVLVYSTAGAVGLATLENMMYIVLVGLQANLFLTIFTTFTRALMAVPLHATTG